MSLILRCVIYKRENVPFGWLGELNEGLTHTGRSKWKLFCGELAARENGVLCLKDTALGAASVLEGLLANIALCPATPEIRRLFTADTWSSGQTSHAQGNVIWCKK